MEDLKGKKLLILGGAYQHRKLVKKAKELGIETYVTDYLEIDQSPAKKMADHSLMYNITDIDEIVEFCKNEKIDGVIAPYLDVTQRPYQKICEVMGWPCFGNAYQHELLTDKKKFEQFCIENNADVIPGFTIEQVETNDVEYPLLIKPTDSRGSRGQTVCFNRQEAVEGIEFALSESKSKEILIEKYLGTDNDMQLVYIVINGKPVLYKVEDRYLGSKEDGLDKLCIATIAPSKNETVFREHADAIVKKMISSIGLHNSPVFIQCFMDGDKARLYDPGIRMPGDDYDDAALALGGVDIPDILIRFALTGKISDDIADKITESRLNGYVSMILPCLKPGRISCIQGLDEINNHPNIITYSYAYNEGDEITATKNVKQRFGEFVIKAKDISELKDTVEWLFKTLHVLDQNKNDMLISCFDTDLLKDYQ